MALLSFLQRFPFSGKVKLHHLGLLALTLCFTLLNALKPLHMDDASFYCFAQQVADHPDSPYGFTILWEAVPRPAIEILAPPVLPYWWGAAIRLFGDRPVLWKLWFLPFNLLLVFSLSALIRRFVHRIEGPLLCMTVLSAALLPGVNLMTDIPALALSLFALVMFLRACDRGSPALAVLAGLVTGLAMQTKYTAFVTPAVLLLYAFVVRRTWWGLLACFLAVMVFVSWESFLLLRHGASHFLCVCDFFNEFRPPLWIHMGRLLLPLFSLVGGLAPGVLLLALAALKWPVWRVVAAGAVVVAAYLLLVCLPEHTSGLFSTGQSGRSRFTVSHLLFGGFGVGLCVTTGAVARRLLRGRTMQQGPGGGAARQAPLPVWVRARLALQRAWFKKGSGTFAGTARRVLRTKVPDPFLNHAPSRRVESFLVLWLGLELAGYFVLSPFPAARRVMPVIVVATLLAGRLAARTCREHQRRMLLRAVAAGSVVLGLTISGVDYLDALASQQSAEAAATCALNHSRGATSWYAGCWGFRFYGERAGLRPLVRGQSQCRQGDYLVIDGHCLIFDPKFPDHFAGRLEAVDKISVADVVPLRTVVDYYAGRKPLTRLEGPRASAMVYRVIADFVPGAPQ
jgi:hypothetical protein